jgi:uncharacterized protein (DUF2141 family)
MKKEVLFISIFFLPLWLSAQSIVKLKVEGVEINGGKIHISVFNSEITYDARDVYMSYSLSADAEIITKEMQLKKGEYLFSVYQDKNGNNKIDNNLIGIPKEKFGFSNYNGKSVPGSFNKHKVIIDQKVENVLITLYKI